MLLMLPAFPPAPALLLCFHFIFILDCCCLPPSAGARMHVVAHFERNVTCFPIYNNKFLIRRSTMKHIIAAACNLSVDEIRCNGG